MKIEKEIEQGLKLMAKSSIIVFIGVFLSKVLGYFYRIIIARSFGPEAYGLFSLATIIVSFFVAICTFGFGEGLIRYLSLYRGKNEINKIRFLIRMSTIFLFFSGLLFGILLFFSSEYISNIIFHDQGLIIYLKILSISIPIFALLHVYANSLRAFEKISWYSFNTNILQNLARVLLILFLIFLGVKADSISLSYLIAAVITIIFSYLICKHELPQIFLPSLIKANEKKQVISEFVSYSWPMMFLGVINSIMFWIDSFSIGYFKNATEVGLYNAAIPIVAIMSITPDLFMQLFLPLITKEFSKKNFELIKEISQQVGKWIFILSLPIFILLFLFPGAIINLLFGQQYLQAENALRILSVGSIFSIFVVLCNNLLSMIGKSRLILMNIFSISLLNLILNIILVPKFGIVGASISTTISGIILSLILLVQIKHFIRIVPLRRKAFKVALVSIIPIIYLILIKQFVKINIFTMTLLGLSFFLIYLTCILLTGCLDKNDILILKSVKNKFPFIKDETQ